MYNIFRILIEVPDYSSLYIFFFSKNEEEAIPPGGKKYLGTTKGSTRMILVHVQRMYKTCYSSIYLGTTKEVLEWYDISTCTEDVQNMLQ